MSESNLEELKLQKRSRFLILLEWEQNRSTQSSKHKAILNTLISRILQKVSISRETNIAVVKFLKERAIGSLHFSEALKSEISYLPDPSGHRQNYTLSTGLSVVSEYQSELSNIFINFSDRIE